MTRIITAIRAFFRIVFCADMARQVERILSGVGPDKGEEISRKKLKKALSVTKTPARSEALTLLATLQREARFVDFIKEPLGDYSDAQIGAAARDVHRDCGALLDRLFEIRPLVSEQEGAQVEVPAGFDASRYRLTGNVAGEPPFAGRVVHHGWQATRSELPTWSGGKSAACVVAPVEVEITQTEDGLSI